MRELLVAALGGLLIVKSLTESQLVANHFGLLQALFIFVPLNTEEELVVASGGCCCLAVLIVTSGYQ